MSIGMQKKALTREIQTSKKRQWESLCRDVDTDVWEEGYKIALRRIKDDAKPVLLCRDKTEAVLEELFPQHKALDWNSCLSQIEKSSQQRRNTARNNQASGKIRTKGSARSDEPTPKQGRVP
ncbi:hypothetical protein Zmor_026654 [Zophobas morio]|uniref:Uncharacterized protein n=1 Tax=Zophobas morio TaxID=2755281 RepID=A0AA38HU45_9CUCU|nr:hypothetical protein Zmor_026654 [Zophobas morio]